MRNFVIVVTIDSIEGSNIARVFTNESDADVFITHCKEVDPRPKWEYVKHQVNINGNPKDPII